MLYKFHAVISTIVIACIFSGCAEAKKTAGIKSGTAYAKIVKAVSQPAGKTITGVESTEELHITITWKTSEKPVSFYWRGDGTWFECMVFKAPMVNNTDSRFIKQQVSFEDVKKNDMLELVPLPGGKYAVPSEIPEKARNTLFFKTAKSGWLSLPVNNIISKVK